MGSQGFLGSLDTPARMYGLAPSFALVFWEAEQDLDPYPTHPRDRGVVREGATGVPRFIWHSPSFAFPLRHGLAADTDLPPPSLSRVQSHRVQRSNITDV